MIPAALSLPARLIIVAADIACLIGAVESHKAQSDMAAVFFMAAMFVSLVGGFWITAGLHP